MTDNTRRIASALCVNLGLILVFIATGMPLLRLGATPTACGPVFGWVYSCGAVLSLIGRLLGPSIAGLPLRERRLRRMETWASVIFIAGAVMIFTVRGNDWIAFTMAGAVITIYAAFMSGRGEK